MKHGGDLSFVTRQVGLSPWLDLSTGISPAPYPFQPLPAECWSRLPQAARLEALLAAARKAYGASEHAPILAAPGTQLLIQLLPVVRRAKRVAIVGPTYSEHGLCWARYGADIVSIPDLDAPSDCNAVVAVNPNNPDGRAWSRANVLACADVMAERGGLLIVDESFADIRPDISVAPHADHPGLVVLRSFGKFFGLAGLRLGFVLGSASFVERLDNLIGPWAVSGPAIEIGAQALADSAWIASARERYKQLAGRLDGILQDAGLTVVGGTDLYRLVSHTHAARIHAALLSHGILTRAFDYDPTWLRFGLPATAHEFERLSGALQEAVARKA